MRTMAIWQYVYDSNSNFDTWKQICHFADSKHMMPVMVMIITLQCMTIDHPLAGYY